MNKFAIALTAVGLLAVTAGLRAQELPEFPKPQKEHEWLKQLAGEWDTTAEMKMEGQPAMTCKGSESARMLGGFWLVSEGKANPMGMQMESLMTLGYDAKSKKYVGTWADSMNEHMWKYEGTLDPTGKILTLETEGPNFFAGGKMTKFKDILEIKDKNHKALSSQIQMEDGTWVTFMTGTYTRKK
ncbi:MAG: DUF1579 domain-containing protein [Planctomycetota bacterium]|nr:DUF1579 domain-containing protein [Planctomycetaceae bacterium]MDQ3332476.1 DUF1579 domain-containing protein [Planctomycetota bacterium]